MPQEVVGVITNVNHNNSETEDLSIAILKYADGSLAQVTASLVAHGEKQEMAFHTERACLTVPWDPLVSKPTENGFSLNDPEGLADMKREYDALEPIKHEGHLGQIDNFLSAVEGKAPLLVDGAEGRQTLELIMGIYKSSVTRMPVRFPLASDDRVYTKEGVQSLMPRFFKKTGNVENFATSEITLGRDVGK
jgi:predicted dehydrogenase